MLTKTCAASGQEFIITDEDLVFYKKMGVPVPTLCPKERQRRRLAWQNMYQLYHRQCDATNKRVISSYAPDTGYIVYDNRYWWSDEFDGKQYGRDFDFSRPFFEQYNELLKDVPHPNLNTDYLFDENSEFCNFAGKQRNCYLVFHASMNEDCLFGTGTKKCKNVVDGFNTHQSELLYECVDCRKCYNLRFGYDCQNCSDSWFLKNCIGCKDCFGCINLKQKQYHLFNKAVGKTAYEEFMENFDSGNYDVVEKLKTQFLGFVLTQPQKHLQGIKNENVTGDHINECKDCFECFDIQESQNLKFCERIYIKPNHDCYDVDQFGETMRWCYECSEIGNVADNLMFSACCRNQITDSQYCFECTGSSHLFGCSGLKRDKYCILNKQYAKEEYEALIPKITEHMKKTGEHGEFFPINISPFAYNESIAQEYYPLSETEIKDRNFKYHQETNSTKYDGPAFEIPSNIKDVNNSLCEKILTCVITGKNYRVVKPELEFYKQMSLPIPRICPDQRHLNRVKLRNPRQLFDRDCAECDKFIQTTFAPTRPEKVLCENCYLAVVN